MDKGWIMDTDSFKYVIAIAEERSISAAARKLYITQPALTKHINKLEKRLGTELLERNSSPVSVTAAGEIFLEYARKYQTMEQEMLSRIDAAAKLKYGTVKAAVTLRGGWYAGKHMGFFGNKYPNIHLEVLSVDSAACEEMLIKGLVDVGFYTTPIVSPEIEYVPLQKDQLVLVTNRNSPVVRDKDLTGNSVDNPLVLDVEELRRKDVRFVCSTPNHSMHHSEKAFFERNGIEPVDPIYVDSIDFRYAITCSGKGFMLVPVISTFAVDVIPPVYCTVRGDAMYRHIVIARRRNIRLSQAAEAYWDTMIQANYAGNDGEADAS